MAQFDLEKQALVGAGGLLRVRADDEITRKLSMLIEGECEGLGPTAGRRGSSASASNATFSCGRLSPNRVAGAAKPQTRAEDPLPTHGGSGPPGDSASLPRSRSLAEVIAQKLCQSGWEISIRSVQRVIEEFGLQKKTLSVSTDR